MIPFSQALQGVVGRNGIAPAILLDVQDTNGNCYYWATRPINAPSVIVATGAPASSDYLPWIVDSGSLTFNRSMQADTGSLTLQNLSGDTLQRDFERIARQTTLEGAIAVYRVWHAAAEAAEMEWHAQISGVKPDPERAQLTLKQLNDTSALVTPPRLLCEICQWRWSSPQCGSTQPTPCQQTFSTCQVVERIFAISNPYEKNYGETWATPTTRLMNRKRQV